MIVWSKVHAHVYILDTSILSTHDNVPFGKNKTQNVMSTTVHDPAVSSFRLSDHHSVTIVFRKTALDSPNIFEHWFLLPRYFSTLLCTWEILLKICFILTQYFRIWIKTHPIFVNNDLDSANTLESCFQYSPNTFEHCLRLPITQPKPYFSCRFTVVKQLTALWFIRCKEALAPGIHSPPIFNMQTDLSILTFSNNSSSTSTGLS